MFSEIKIDPMTSKILDYLTTIQILELSIPDNVPIQTKEVIQKAFNEIRPSFEAALLKEVENEQA